MPAKSRPSLTLRTLPAFSPVAAKLMTALRRENVNLKEAADLVKSDAGISAEVLRLANSAMSDLRFTPISILQTLTLLGTKRVASLIATLCVGRLLARVSKLPVMRRCWRNNLATALVAERWAENYNVEPETGYMIGLLAGIGRLALLVSEPIAYSQMLEKAQAEGLLLESLEAAHFGFDSREAGAWLVSEWKLPQELLQVFDPRTGSAGRSRLGSLIQEANAEAARLGFGLSEAPLCDALDPASFEVAMRVNRIEQELGI